jgi:4-amino-4-deoxy-L-arabinose transferase-like glycosyltransferase
MVLLTITPPGFYLDEAASGSHVVSMLANGTNAHGESWPLYSASLGGGYTTPIYLYPLTAWAFLFGTSEYALRAFSLFATILAAALLSLTVRLWLGNKAAVIAGLTSLILPWGWIQGSLAWDPALVPLFMAASLLCVSIALKAYSARHRVIAAAASGLALIALAYLYPPCRVTAPLLLASYYGLLFYQKKISLRFILITAGAFALLCVPLLQFMLQPDALERSSELSVFHNTTIAQGLWQVIVNFFGMLSPMFLFGTGDSNLRHSTGYQGMLGFAAIPPLVALLYVALRKLRHYMQTWRQPISQMQWLGILSIACVAFSLLGSALTAEGQPHSLRATAAWPFFVVLITMGWSYVTSRLSQTLRITVLALAAIATIAYVYDLTVRYPARSADAFDVSSRQIIKSGQNPVDYPQLSIFYYEHK